MRTCYASEISDNTNDENHHQEAIRLRLCVENSGLRRKLASLLVVQTHAAIADKLLKAEPRSNPGAGLDASGITKLMDAPLKTPGLAQDATGAFHAVHGSDDVREAFAAEMIKRGLATGHGDTLADLHREMWWQFDELRNRQNR